MSPTGPADAHLDPNDLDEQETWQQQDGPKAFVIPLGIDHPAINQDIFSQHLLIIINGNYDMLFSLGI